MKKQRKCVWSRSSNIFCFRISQHLMDTVDFIITTSGRYISRNDFIREAIRKLVDEELRILHHTTHRRSSKASEHVNVIDIHTNSNRA